MRRRALLAGASALLLTGFIRPETLPKRQAQFEEVGDSVLLTVALPGLLRKRDREAMASIDSGISTTLVYEIQLFEWGKTTPILTVRYVVKLHYDLWQKRYVVTMHGSAGAAGKRYFVRREDAIERAVTLERVRIARASSLGRGPNGPYYFATVRALRNPIVPPARASGGATSGRGEGRSPAWFRRLVHFLGGATPRAEQTLHVRTTPFYLTPR